MDDKITKAKEYIQMGIRLLNGEKLAEDQMPTEDLEPGTEKIYEDPGKNALKIDGEGNVTLKLESGTAVRRLGKIDYQYKQFHTERSKAKGHLMVKSNSWGFNYECIKRLKQHDISRIILTEVDENKKYTTTVDNLLENGKFLFFKQQGYEKQIFLPLDKFETY